MRELSLRFFITLAFLILSGYLLYPTVQDYLNSKNIAKAVEQKLNQAKKNTPSITEDQLSQIRNNVEDSIKNATPSFRDARKKRIKLGLDLQGGMRIVLEVNTGKLLEKIANNPDDVFLTIVRNASAQAAVSDAKVVDLVVKELKARGIRLSRYFGNVRDDDDKIVSSLTKQTEDAVSRAMEIIRNRVDQYGVSEPSIVRTGERRIIVELPGVAKEEEARQLLQGTALLEFRLLKEPELTAQIVTRIDQVLAGKPIDDTTKTDSTNAKDTANNSKKSEEELKKEHPFFALAQFDPQGRHADAYVAANDREKLNKIFARPDIQKIIPNNAEFIFSAKPIGKAKDGQDVYMMYFVNKNPELTGGVVTNALANLDPTSSQPVVSMEMNSEGASEWARITGANVNKRCAIILDGVAFSAPVIRNKITGGRSQIEGMANLDEAKLLEIVLKAGALPAPVEIMEQRSVGPSLGQDSISQGLNSAIFGYLLVGLFMIIYYQRAGSIAALGLTVTILFILSILAGFKATLTLPGIAGIVLTMGMAVDANVLIYERIREEVALGKSMRAAVDSGFARANSAIIDSNLTTMITGIILYQFGTGPIQGFALTLMIGIITSMFAALVVARLVFDFMLNKGYQVSLG